MYGKLFISLLSLFTSSVMSLTCRYPPAVGAGRYLYLAVPVLVPLCCASLLCLSLCSTWGLCSLPVFYLCAPLCATSDPPCACPICISPPQICNLCKCSLTSLPLYSPSLCVPRCVHHYTSLSLFSLSWLPLLCT